jgi:iron-sulfur cluster assembly protein
MPVSLTPAAIDRARQYIAQQPGGAGLRFGVRKNGCSGFAYVIDVAASAGQGDTVVEADGVPVFIDAASLPHVDGTEIDFVRRGLNQEFVFRNPQATGECGCGESFTTRDDLPV